MKRSNGQKYALTAALLALVIGLDGPPAAAEWMVFYVNPPGQPGSGGDDTVGTQHVGYVRVGPSCLDASPHAAIWEGTSSEWIDLHPSGTVYSFANGTTGTQQAGSAIPAGGPWYHAALWSGTAESFVELHPPGATESNAYSIGGTQQVGSVKAGSPPHAALWEGTPESYVNLNPADTQFSVALDTNGHQQVGYVVPDHPSTATARPRSGAEPPRAS